MLTRIALAVSFALVAGAAHATTIATPFLTGESSLSCAVTNAGTKDTKIGSVKLIDPAGAVISPSNNSCGAVLGPKQSCFLNKFANTDGYCEVVGSGTLRVVIISQGPSGVAALPGTK